MLGKCMSRVGNGISHHLHIWELCYKYCPHLAEICPSTWILWKSPTCCKSKENPKCTLDWLNGDNALLCKCTWVSCEVSPYSISTHYNYITTTYLILILPYIFGWWAEILHCWKLFDIVDILSYVLLQNILSLFLSTKEDRKHMFDMC